MDCGSKYGGLQYLILCLRSKILYVNSKFSSVHNAWYCQKLISEDKKSHERDYFLRSSLFFSYSCNFAPFATWLFIFAGVTWSKFHIEDPKIFGTIFQNLVARTTRLLGFVYSCIIFLTIFPSQRSVPKQSNPVQSLFKICYKFYSHHVPIFFHLSFSIFNVM